MADYKMEAAKAAIKLIQPGQTIGLGAGSTIAALLALLAAEGSLAASLTLVSSSFKTTSLIREYGFNVQSIALTKSPDIYFDGCDQFDIELNALKSGGGIHTSEKILASLAAEFILIGDAGKFVNKLDATYPLVIEALPAALQLVQYQLFNHFPDAKINLRMGDKKDGAAISDNGNMLLDVYFTKLIPLDELNVLVKMVPGVVEHSLFYRMATRAIIAGPEGVRIMKPEY
ncbi:ribose 5-phosphate isomerase A [Mucilaginibacter gotjawali]|uniref:Ribose-5-phosphate isomerase A n=2 Tax=Mucilaginibacter gotjawali TaxID=1550579 RepID=A0A120MY28_9SPHI|nr:ribose 5-phosphate isomerase A [Mucilaginibacter gotjawali]MBB3058612.1 ribose 5-phosphate isomerase A [Mucilaginibacter gotjawali]BAU52421.1 Ribose-5-phosphate isomerase A [Mucilaginibacter gotjawali]